MEFTTRKKDFKKLNAEILGISPDKISAQKKFADKHNLTIPLLSDEGVAVTTKYGCYGEKKLYGRTFMGIIRSTYLIDPKGKVAKVWSKVRVNGHVETVLNELKALQS